MARYVTIFRWKPENAREAFQITQSLPNRTAPKEILAAAAKIKIISQNFCPYNNLSIVIYEIDEKDFVETSLITMYFQGVFSMETYPVLNEADSTKLNQMFIKAIPGVMERE
ncbi:MAG: hypothetical protein ACFE8A_05600 [Candidatus Hodarchaeota archaeon]